MTIQALPLVPLSCRAIARQLKRHHHSTISREVIRGKPEPGDAGSNENANGLIREYLPKGMDLSSVCHQQLTAIEHSLNHRPRKILGFQSPHEVFSQLRQSRIAGVALQA